MKGFTITPILFVGLFIIIGFMLISFSDMDRKFVSGIDKETRLNRLSANYLEYKSVDENLLYIYSAQGSVGASTINQLEGNITKLVGNSVYVTSCTDTYFTSQHNKTFIMSDSDVSINTSYTISKNITCADIYGMRLATPNPISISCQVGIFTCPAQP